MFITYKVNYRTLENGAWNLHFWNVTLPPEHGIDVAIANRHWDADVIEIISSKKRKVKNPDNENVHMSYYRNLGVVEEISERDEQQAMRQSTSL